MQTLWDALIALDALAFTDLDGLESLLHLQWQPERSEGVVTVREATTGTIAGLDIGRAELRARADDPRAAMLVLVLATPGPDLRGFKDAHLADADYLPASPRASASLSYWRIPFGSGRLSVGAPVGTTGITAIVIDRMP